MKGFDMQNAIMTKRIFAAVAISAAGLMLMGGCASKPTYQVQMDTSDLPAAKTAPSDTPAPASAPAAYEPAPEKEVYKPTASPAPLNPEAEKSKPAARPIRKVDPPTLTDAMNAPQKPASKRITYYTVRQDDTFWSISRRVYGSGKYWRKIQDANPDISPERLFVGQKIVIPQID